MNIDFQPRTIKLIGQPQRQAVIALAENVPDGIEVVFRPPVKSRKPDQNALMWVGPLADIAAQAWVDGRQYSDEVWHHHFKVEYLPDEDDPDLHDLVRDPCGYRKWDTTPGGERVLVGSTKDLTVKGFSLHLEKVYAFGASLGVMFGARGNWI